MHIMLTMYRDHDLAGNYKGCRECHIEPDWLLIYEVINDVLVLMLYRVGIRVQFVYIKRKSPIFRDFFAIWWR